MCAATAGKKLPPGTGCRPAGQHVARDDCTRKEAIERRNPQRPTGSGDSIMVVAHQIVGQLKAGDGRRPVRVDDCGTVVVDRVAIENHVGRPVFQVAPASRGRPMPCSRRKRGCLERSGRAHIRLLGTSVVGSEDVHTCPRVAENVETEGDVFNRTPGAHSTGIAWSEHDGESRLRSLPAVLHDIAVDQHAAGVLQFEEVLDRPGRGSARTSGRSCMTIVHDGGRGGRPGPRSAPPGNRP